VVAAPKAGEHFTEFYVLGVEGETDNYPSELVVGQEATVTLGIVNHEGGEDELPHRGDDRWGQKW